MRIRGLLRSNRGFTIIEMIISLLIMMSIFWLLFVIIRSSWFLGDFQEKKTASALRKINSDFQEIFLQYPIASGAVYADVSPDKYFDRIGLVYSGGTVIIAVADKNTGNILDAYSNDNGFLGWRAIPGTVDVTAYAWQLDNMSEAVNITDLRATNSGWLLRIEAIRDTEIIGGERENYSSGKIILVKNLNH